MPEKEPKAHPPKPKYTSVKTLNRALMLVSTTAAVGCASSRPSSHSGAGQFTSGALSDTSANDKLTENLIHILPETPSSTKNFSDTEVGQRLIRMTGRQLTPQDTRTLIAVRALLVAQRELREQRPLQARELAKFVLSTEHLGTQIYAMALRYLAMADAVTMSGTNQNPQADSLARSPMTEFNAFQALQCSFVCSTHGWQVLAQEEPALFSAAGYRTWLLSEAHFNAEKLKTPQWLRNIFSNSIPTSKKDEPDEIPTAKTESSIDRIRRLRILVEGRKWTLVVPLARKILNGRSTASHSIKSTKECPAEVLYAQYALAQATRIAQDRRKFAQLQDEFVSDLDRSRCTHEAFAFDKDQFDSFKLDARLWLARLQWEQNKNPQAFFSARKVLTDAAQVQSWEHFIDAAKVLVGRVGFEMLNGAENLSVLDALEKAQPASDSDEFLIWILSRRGLIQFLSGEFEPARKSFDRIIELTQDSSTRSMAFYWIGRTHHAASKTGESENAFLSAGATDPLSIYDIFSGQLLMRESGRASTQAKQAFYVDWKTELNTWLQLDESKPLKIVTSVPPRTSLAVARQADLQQFVSSQKQFDLSLETAMLLVTLIKAATIDLTADEFTHFVRGSDELIPSYIRAETQYLRQSFQRLNSLHSEVLPRAHQIAWLTHILGDHANAILFVGRLRDTLGWDTDYLPFLYFIFYPRPYAQQFSQAAEKCGVDVDLLYAVSRQESLFQASVKSHVGAVGLMQLLPSTAARVLKVRPEFKNGEKIDLTDPAVNTVAGACYLAQLLERYNNNLTFAVAAYNAGEAAVDKWVSNRQKLADMPYFIEFIPFAETKTYVQRVLRNYYNLKWIYR